MISREGIGKTRDWGEKQYRVSTEESDSTIEYEKDDLCDKCKIPPGDPVHEDLVLYLHAYKYSGPDWEFETEMPYWAKEGFESPTVYSKYA